MTAQLDDLHRSVGRIEGKLDTFIAQMATQDERTTKITERIGKVESRQAWYSGAGSMVGMILGALGMHGLKY